MSELAPADLRWLEAAARMAMPWRGTTAENPTVGAIVVSPDGVVRGRGVTAPGGRPHAEPLALAMAGERARGATLYVTLEPCNHWGQTPPCVDAVVAAGVARVVCGSIDPDPRTAGKSIAKLKDAGIAVSVGESIRAAERLHEGFISRIRRGRPFVSAKLAVSRDGMIGRRGEGNVRITGEEARRWTHMQRALSEAIMVGAGTARLDDPRLDVRLSGLEDRRPVRVVVAGRQALPEDLRLFLTNSRQVSLVAGKDASVQMAFRAGDVVSVAGQEGGPDPAAVLQLLARGGIGRVLVEGGAALNDALLDTGLIDRFHLLESEETVGAAGVRASAKGPLPERLAQLGFTPVESRSLGCDMLTTFEKA